METVREQDPIQRGLRRLYARVGPRGVAWLAVVGSSVISVATTTVTFVWLARYVGLSSGKTLTLLAFGLGTALAIVAAAAFAGRRGVRGLLAWSDDAVLAAQAPRIWKRVIRAPRALIMRPSRVAAIVSIPLVPLAIEVLDLPAGATPVGYVAVALAIAANAVLVVFTLELLFRPMVEDIAARLPPDFEPSVTTWPLRTKALAPLPIVTLFAALSVGAFADLVDNGIWRLVLALGIALGFVAVASAIFLIVTRSVLDPLGDLSAATQRVRAGDLSTPVPVVTADELGMLAADFNRMLVGLREREQLRNELQESRARIVAASDDARRAVERDLHDGAQQDLVLLNLKLGMLERTVGSDPHAMALVAETREDLARALDQLRELAHGIYPAALESDGLAGALDLAVRRAGIAAEVQADGTGRYPRELEAAVYFCCLEALQNASKHAGDDARVTVCLRGADDRLEFSVADDGLGFDGELDPDSAGLRNMADRVGALGGHLDVSSRPGQGTKVQGAIPLAGPATAPTPP